MYTLHHHPTWFTDSAGWDWYKQIIPHMERALDQSRSLNSSVWFLFLALSTHFWQFFLFLGCSEFQICFSGKNQTKHWPAVYMTFMTPCTFSLVLVQKLVLDLKPCLSQPHANSIEFLHLICVSFSLHHLFWKSFDAKHSILWRVVSQGNKRNCSLRHASASGTAWCLKTRMLSLHKMWLGWELSSRFN